MKLSVLSFLCLIFLAGVAHANPQPEKRLQKALRVDHAPKIDGVLDENLWNTRFERVPFVQYQPNNGQPSKFESAVQIIYTDKAMYVAARLYDAEPDKILHEFGQRDDTGRNADWFGIILDTYNSGNSAFTFFVSAAGVQGDFFLTGGYWDPNWDAVWKSAVKINDDGWVVEIEIPYYSIRFPRQEVQEWGVNFFRSVKRNQEESYWNHIDNSVQGIVNQSGSLRGIEKVQPPLRLSFSPYLTSIFRHNSGSGSGDFSITGGMDVKYGINESYTLDLSLIPDFSQVQSDPVVLNLSAYEVRFNENRQFFTEGTELFNKGNLFYSRRVGSTFGTVSHDAATEEVVSAPASANLLNAVKISGRNKKGLGLGFFNAITDRTKARVRNKENGLIHEVDVDPLTNFNLFVIDQNMRNNSNINFTTTSVIRDDGGRDATVSGLSLAINDRTMRFRVRSFASVSNIAGVAGAPGNDTGYKYSIDLAKASGTWQYGVGRNVETKNYQVNDLGYLRAPNEISHSGYLRYSIFKPMGVFNRLNSTVSFFNDVLFEPRKFSALDISANSYAQFKNFWAVGVRYGFRPTRSYDYFEPRTDGYFVKLPVSSSFNLSVESDSRKPLKANLYSGRWTRSAWEQKSDWLGLFLRYRVNNKLSVNVEVNSEETNHSRGYVTKEPVSGTDEIIFGERNIRSATNTAGVNYTFNNKMGLNLRVRHYWSKVKYNSFYQLTTGGDLLDTSYKGVDADGAELHDTNFNTVNLDLVYSLQVAPGSFFNLVWKDAIQSLSDEAGLDYFASYRQAMQAPQQNNISVRFTYFLDYFSIKKSMTRS